MCPVCNAVFDLEGVETEDEGISVEDAAQIWISHSRDEDYMFGFTEDELGLSGNIKKM